MPSVRATLKIIIHNIITVKIVSDQSGHVVCMTMYNIQNLLGAKDDLQKFFFSLFSTE